MKKFPIVPILCLCLCLCLLLIPIGAKAAGTSVDVIADYSAAGNGTTDDRAAIQAAIDAVHAAGGGTVTLTAGKTFLSGNLILRSNVELHFGDGAVLKQNPDQNAYVKPEGDTLVSYTPARGHNTISGVRWGHSFYKSYPLIYAGEGTTNVKITGAGTIEMTPEEKCADTIHLCPVGLYRVSNFTISDITIIKSSAYGMMPFTCTDGLIQNVTMKDFVSSTPDVADHLNGDGISLQNCQNIRVTGCNLSVTDDAIYIFTSYRDPRGGTWWNSNNPQPSTNIEIDHNITQTTCKGFGLILWGSSCPDQYKVEVSNVHVHDNTFSSMGIWNDDPFDDLSVPTPAKNIRFENNTIKKIQDNFYATPISDMNVYPSMTGFRNTGFEDREVYWVAVRNNDASSIGTSNYGCGQDGTYFAYLQNVHTGPAELYQGLYLEAKTIYSFSAKMMTKGNPFQMFVRNLDTQEIIASQDYSTASYSTGAWELKTLNFTVPASGNYQIGIRTKDGITYGSGDAARIDSVSMTSAPISEKSIFTTQFPDKFGNDNVYELGTRFKALVKGRITKVRLYTNAEESGIHTVRLWDYSAKTLVAGPYEWDVAAGTDGWQEFTLPTPLSIEANKDYVVAISNSSDNKYYAQGTQAENSLASSVSNGYLVGYAKGGLWFRGTGSMPYNAVNNNYFRDVVFEPDEQTILTTQTPTDFDNDTFYELGTRFQTRKDGFITRVRLYTNAEESGIHTVRLWDYSAKTLVAGPYEWDVAAGTDGWQEFSLPAPLSVEAGKDYVVAISNNAGNKLYVRGSDVGNSFTTAIRIGDLVTYSGSGLWSRTAGQMPYNKSTTNYFRDVVFVTDSINRDALRNAVNANKDKTQGNYTDATWQAFTAALSSAQAVLSDTAATQAQVNEAAAALSAAANDLAEPEPDPEPTEPTYKSASITLENDLSVNFKVDAANAAAAGYTDLYTVFSIHGMTFTSTGEEKDGLHVYTLRSIQPDWMGDTITAKLYGTKDGGEVLLETREYSVAQYCMTQLAEYDGEKAAQLRTLLVDLLNYGAAAQVFTGYNTDALVNAALTEEQKAWGTTADPNPVSVLALSEMDAPAAQWAGVALYLRDTTRIRLHFTSELTEGLTLKVTCGEREWIVDQADFQYSGNHYYVYFDHVSAQEMRTAFQFTVCAGDQAVSQTLTYSVASYAANATGAVKTMTDAMLCYGDSAAAYMG